MARSSKKTDPKTDNTPTARRTGGARAMRDQARAQAMEPVTPAEATALVAAVGLEPVEEAVAHPVAEAPAPAVDGYGRPILTTVQGGQQEVKQVVIEDRRKADRGRRAEDKQLKIEKKEDANAKAQAASERAKDLQDRNAQIVSDILGGMTRKAVAKKHGISSSRVHELLVAAGYKRQDTKHSERDALIVEDLLAGKTPKQVAEETGLSTSRIKLIWAGRDCKPVAKQEEEVKA